MKPFKANLPPILICVLLEGQMAFGGGTITQCTEANLRSAMAGGGTVTFACSGTITLTKTLAVTQNTTITATGYQVSLSGGNGVRLFAVTNASFQVNGVTLADGRALGAGSGQDAQGGCLVCQGGAVALVDCTLTNHFAKGADDTAGSGSSGLGGAICGFGSQLSLTNCLVVNCSAQGGMAMGSSRSALGGALYLTGGSLNLRGVTFTNNSAVGGAGWMDYTGGSGGGPAYGGAIYAGNSAVQAVNTTLLSNTVTGGAQAYGISGTSSGDGHGGALYLTSDATAVFNLCTFQGNSASSSYPGYHGTCGSGRGGAVYNLGGFQAWNSTFSGNLANGYSGLFGDRLGQGGAVYSTDAAVISGCTFLGNKAQGGSGSSGVQYGATGAPGEGGAIWSAGVLWATNSTLATNLAAGGAYGFTRQGAAGSGGGLCLTGGSATLVHLTFAGNRADGWFGYAVGEPGPSQGGGILSTNSQVLLLNSVLADSPSVTNSSGKIMTGGGNVWGTITDGGYNLSSDSTGGFSAPTSHTNTDPGLSPLANNGGPTLTLALALGSPARDTIPAGYPATDQRGVARPQGTAADSGAFEASAAGCTLGSVSIVVDSGAYSGSFTVSAVDGYEWEALSSCDWIHTSSSGTGNGTVYYQVDPNPSTQGRGWQTITVGGQEFSISQLGVNNFAVTPHRAGTHFTVSFPAEGNRPYRLLSSTDLVTWISIATNALPSAGSLQLSNPINSPKAFYRVVTP